MMLERASYGPRSWLTRKRLLGVVSIGARRRRRASVEHVCTIIDDKVFFSFLDGGIDEELPASRKVIPWATAVNGNLSSSISNIIR